jgi:hypothetical protein
MIKEDAPVNNVGSGNIPGAGVAAAGKPANFGDAIVSSGAAKQWKKQNAMFRRKKPIMEETFAGATVFEVNSKLFHSLTLAKRKGKHWRTYLEEDDCYAEIREWAIKNPKSKIVVRNESTGEMRYIRY